MGNGTIPNRTQEEPPTLPNTSIHAFRTRPWEHLSGFVARTQCLQLKAKTETLRAEGSFLWL